jgi:hypothetical protein
MAEPPLFEGAYQEKVTLDEVVEPPVKLSGASGTVAASTDSVGPSGPSPCTFLALTAN